MPLNDELSIKNIDKLFDKKQFVLLHNAFPKLFSSVRTSKLLNHLLYLSRLNGHKEFVRSQKSLMKAIGMKPSARKSFFRSMQHIKKLQIFDIRQCTSPPLYHYKLDIQRILIILKNSNLAEKNLIIFEKL